MWSASVEHHFTFLCLFLCQSTGLPYSGWSHILQHPVWWFLWFSTALPLILESQGLVNELSILEIACVSNSAIPWDCVTWDDSCTLFSDAGQVVGLNLGEGLFYFSADVPFSDPFVREVPGIIWLDVAFPLMYMSGFSRVLSIEFTSGFASDVR